MHIPDGFLNAGTSVGGGVVAAGGLTLCVRRTADVLEDKQIPLAGLVAAFIFAVQMLNFPVANGTSGHLLGAVLAAVLVGPYAGALAVTVVLIVQALLFADGGVTALGLNVTNMALLGTAAGYLVIVALLRLRIPLFATALLASVISVLVAAQGFVLEYALGGGNGLSVGAMFAAMSGSHLLIGLGEGLITAVTVAAVARSRPDLVYALRRRPVESSSDRHVVQGAPHVA